MTGLHEGTGTDMSNQNFMRTLSGRKIYFREPNPDNILITDIASHLALINRYNGGTIFPYSVGQHCIHMSYAVDPEFALEALLHDAVEMVVGDNISPMKNEVPELRPVEGRVDDVIRQKWGLPLHMSKEVKIADARMYLTEVRDLRPQCDFQHVRNEIGLEPYDFTIKEMHWLDVKAEYLQRFDYLTGHPNRLRI